MEKEQIITVMKRYELKYYLNSDQLAYFMEKILEHMKVDKYGLTSIASLYYDTPNYSLINRSIEKPAYKEKIRLRSYGLAKENTSVFLEVKRKIEGMGGAASSYASFRSAFPHIGSNDGMAPIGRQRSTIIWRPLLLFARMGDTPGNTGSK